MISVLIVVIVKMRKERRSNMCGLCIQEFGFVVKGIADITFANPMLIRPYSSIREGVQGLFVD